MATFEWIIVLLLGAALLAALARKVGAPYPTFLALGGVGLAFVPSSPNWTLDPQLALTLFVAPVLLDAAYDTSLRDLRANWRPVSGLVVAAVGTTVLTVACTAHWLIPAMPWPVAIALGAIVAPPDAAAARTRTPRRPRGCRRRSAGTPARSCRSRTARRPRSSPRADRPAAR
ncbi:MAG: cation:proton antiporter, partial [Caldimonas sp.]